MTTTIAKRGIGATLALAACLTAPAMSASAATPGSWSADTLPPAATNYNWFTNSDVLASSATPPATSAIATINYEWGFYLPHDRNPGTIAVRLCSVTPSKCTNVSAPATLGGSWENGDLNYTAKGSTSDFKGFPANTQFYYSYAWLNPKKNYEGLVMYGLRPCGRSKVTVNYQGI